MDIHQEAWTKFRAGVLQQLRSAKHIPPEVHPCRRGQYLVLPTFGEVICIDIVDSGGRVSATRTVWSVEKDQLRFRDPVEFLRHRADESVSIQTEPLDWPELGLTQVVSRLQEFSRPTMAESSHVQLDGVAFELVFSDMEKTWRLAWRQVVNCRLPKQLQTTVATLNSLVD